MRAPRLRHGLAAESMPRPASLHITTIMRETKATGRDFAKAGCRIDFEGARDPDCQPPCARHFRVPRPVHLPGRCRWRGAPSRDGRPDALVYLLAGAVLAIRLEFLGTMR
jgi:hypothetical protein